MDMIWLRLHSFPQNTGYNIGPSSCNGAICILIGWEASIITQPKKKKSLIGMHIIGQSNAHNFSLKLSSRYL